MWLTCTSSPFYQPLLPPLGNENCKLTDIFEDVGSVAKMYQQQRRRQNESSRSIPNTMITIPLEVEGKIFFFLVKWTIGSTRDTPRKVVETVKNVAGTKLLCVSNDNLWRKQQYTSPFERHKRFIIRTEICDVETLPYYDNSAGFLLVVDVADVPQASRAMKTRKSPLLTLIWQEYRGSL